MPMSYVCDMDGVIYHGSRLIPGALEFVQRLQSRGHKFLFLTNNSQWTPRDLKHKLEQMGISVDEAAFHTSALATAEFPGRQKPGGTAYVIGGAEARPVQRRVHAHREQPGLRRRGRDPQL